MLFGYSFHTNPKLIITVPFSAVFIQGSFTYLLMLFIYIYDSFYLPVKENIRLNLMNLLNDLGAEHFRTFMHSNDGKKNSNPEN